MSSRTGIAPKARVPGRLVPAARTAGMALFLLTCLNLFNFIDRYILPGVQPLVQKEFRVNDAQIGLLTTVFFFTYMIIAPLTGWLGDRMPRKPLIIGGTLLWSLATLFTAYVHSYQTLLIRHAMVGVGEATFSIFAPAMLSDFYPEADRNRILSIFYITIPLGGAFGYLTGGILGQRFGWRMPFFVAALPGVLIALAFYFFVREPQRGAADSLAPTFNRATFSGLFRNPAFWTATLGLAMWTFAVGGISTWLPTFLVRFGSMSVAKAGTLAGALTVVDGLLGTIIGGWLAHRWLRTQPPRALSHLRLGIPARHTSGRPRFLRTALRLHPRGRPSPSSFSSSAPDRSTPPSSTPSPRPFVQPPSRSTSSSSTPSETPSRLTSSGAFPTPPTFASASASPSSRSPPPASSSSAEPASHHGWLRRMIRTESAIEGS